MALAAESSRLDVPARAAGNSRRFARAVPLCRRQRAVLPARRSMSAPTRSSKSICSRSTRRGDNGGSEIFAADRLGDAVARLYERYAELLPDGPARARAAATARSVAAVVAPVDLDQLRHGARARHRSRRPPAPSGSDPARSRNVAAESSAPCSSSRKTSPCASTTSSASRSDALLVRWTNFGHRPRRRGRLRAVVPPASTSTEPTASMTRMGAVRRRPRGRGARPLRRADGRAGGGAIRDRAIPSCDEARAPGASERRDRARRPPGRRRRRPGRRRAPRPARRRVRSRGPYDRRHLRPAGRALSFRKLLRSAQDPSFVHEPLATLGDALALCRLTRSASGFVGRNVRCRRLRDRGPQPDRGRRAGAAGGGSRCSAAERLGDAVARLVRALRRPPPRRPGAHPRRARSRDRSASLLDFRRAGRRSHRTSSSSTTALIGLPRRMARTSCGDEFRDGSRRWRIAVWPIDGIVDLRTRCAARPSA